MSQSNTGPGTDARSVRLLRTKLFIPRAHADIIPRPHLVDKLNAGLRCKLILVSAPAGSGKTTLLSEWISGGIKNPKIAWVSLDEKDNDPALFWAYFLAALQTLQPGLGTAVQSAIASPQPPPQETFLADILNEVAALPDEVVLVLDDYHTITAQPIHSGIDFIIENLPAQMHLVIAGRADPPLPLPQLRVRRQLIELHAADLRFSREEVAAFLNQVMRLRLTAQDIAELDRLTEGWVAGLQLAALSMQGIEDMPSFLQSFSGSHRYVFDYLAQEVLNRQSEAVRDFLLQTSILDRLSAELCSAALGEGDPGSELTWPPSASQDVLEQLERSNLFLVPLDQQRNWYRYHHLFAEFLRAWLGQATQPEQIAGLHRRASRWFEGQGLAAEAIGHAMQAGDHERAARLIRAAAEEMFLRSELVTLLRWLKDLPSPVLRADAELSMIAAWALLATSQTETIDSHLVDVERILGVEADGSAESLSQPARIRGALAEISCIRATLAFNQMDVDRVIALCRQAQTYLQESEAEGIYNKQTSIRAASTFNLAIAHEFRGEMQEATEAFVETISRSHENPNLIPMATSHLAQLQILQGQLREAEETYRKALRWVEQREHLSPLSGMAYTGLGNLFCERNELETAARYLTQGLELGRQWNQWESLLAGTFGLARVKAAQGDFETAWASLKNLAEAADRLNVALVRPAIRAQQVLYSLRMDDLTVAKSWQREINLPSEGDIPYLLESEASLLVRVMMASHEYPAAIALADRVLRAAQTGRRWARVIETLNLKAQALAALGDVEEARASLLEALTLAAPEGYMRIFLDEGPSLETLIRSLEVNDPELQNYQNQLVSAFPRKKNMTAPKIQAAPTTEPMIEPLSERELEVLRLIAQGMTNQEIADQLVISLNTVKTHVKNILGCLDVENRTQAAARARERGII